jgi:cytochrome b561
MMSEPKLTQDTADPPDHSRKASFLRRKLPYVAVLSLAIAGVAFTNMSHQPISGFWEFLAVAIGVVCVTTAWPNVHDRKARFRLIWTQALHWATFLVIMNIMLLPHVQRWCPRLQTVWFF